MKKKFDAILLLGVGLGENDQPTGEMHERVRAAARAYQEGYAPVIVCCGGVTRGHRVSEAVVMEKLLKEAGVPGDAILLEDKSQVTSENLRFAAKVLGGSEKKRVLVVTSDYHLMRSVLTARRAGFSARGYAAVLPHDGVWKQCRKAEWAYTVDLLCGWQDEGKSRPEWTYKLFDLILGKKIRKTA